MKKLFTSILGYALPLIPLTARAVDTTGGLPASPDSGIQNVTDFLLVLCAIVNVIFWVLIVVAIIFVLVAAFRYLTAQGDPEKVKKANFSLLYAAIAIVVGIIANAVPAIVASFTSADGIEGGCNIL